MSSYDLLPYDTKPGAASHPDSLFAMSRLHGLDPAPIERCKVLEIGCATGENLIPMAAALPQATFVGIDLSEVQIHRANQTITALELKNIRCLQQDLQDLGSEPFDYVLCHGVYSWVSQPVRDVLMARIRALLAPEGVAYISWNAMPGWKVLGTLRDLLQWQTRSLDDPRDKVHAARMILADLPSRPTRDALFSLVQRRAEALAEAPDTYLMHEFLTEHNTALYYEQFEAHTAHHGLQIVSEADLGSEARLGFSLDPGSDPQLTDFQVGRTFHRSILCRDDASPRSLDVARLHGLFVRCELQPGQRRGESLAFDLAGTEVMHTAHPLLQRVLTALGNCYPSSLAFTDLADGHGGSDLGDMLIRGATQGFLDFGGRIPGFSTTPGSHPQAWAPARWAASLGRPWAPNLLHEPIRIGALETAMLVLLDGTRTRAQVLTALQALEPTTRSEHAEGCLAAMALDAFLVP